MPSERPAAAETATSAGEEPEGGARAAPPGRSSEAAAPLEWAAAGLPRHLWAVVMVFDISVDLPTPHAVVTLREVAEPHRLLAFPAALADATALAHAWRGVATPRPLTHELFASALVSLGGTIEVVRLLGRRAGVVLAELELSSARGREVLACRPTDGLTLAVRQGVPAPILVDERLFHPEGDVDADGDVLS